MNNANEYAIIVMAKKTIIEDDLGQKKGSIVDNKPNIDFDYIRCKCCFYSFFDVLGANISGMRKKCTFI